jgi:hypothetical protein
MSSGLSSGAASTGDDPATTGPIYPPYEPLCDAPATEIIVTAAETPMGPLSVDLAWLGHAACYPTPYVALVQLPVDPSEYATEVFIRLGPEEGVPSPWTGTHPASIGFNVEAVGTVEFLEPLQWAEVPDGMLTDHHLSQRSFNSSSRGDPRRNEHVQVFGRARMTVERDCVAADHHELRLGVHERDQYVAKIVGQVHRRGLALTRAGIVARVYDGHGRPETFHAIRLSSAASEIRSVGDNVVAAPSRAARACARARRALSSASGIGGNCSPS